MHPVGHRADRDLGGVETGPQPREHLPADDAVQLADAVRTLREPQTHVGHVEDVGVGLHPELQDPLDRHTGPAVVPAEMAGDQAAREPVDAGGDGGVGGEQRAGAGGLERLVEAEPVLDELPDPL